MTRGDTPHIILAFDYGTRRIGIASGDTLTRTARALCTLERREQEPWNEIERLRRDYLPAQLVVGVPYNVDGSDTLLTAVVLEFARQLEARCKLPVALVDERYSSIEAAGQLSAARRSGLKSRRVTRGDIDKEAARLLLERWFAGDVRPANADADHSQIGDR